MKILKEIRRMMAEIVEAKLPLNMSMFYQGLSFHDMEILQLEQKTIHQCGTAACIAGYMVLDKGVRKQMGVGEREYFTPAAAWILVDEEIGESLAYSLLSNCVRKMGAKDSGLFSNREMGKIRHLSETHPTAKDALVFIDILLEKLEKES